MAALLLTFLGVGSVQAQCDLDEADFTLTVQQSLVNATQLKCTYNGSSQSWSNNWALYVTNLTTGETQTYVSSSTTKSITSISAGEYSWYIRAICSTNDTSNIVNGDNFTVTYEPWPTWTNFQFQKSTDTYYLYCNNMIDYDFSSGNNLNNTTGVSNNGNNITYTFEPEGICTYNNQTNRLNFTGEPGDVVITATISGYNSYPDTSASFTLTVIKPELKFERVTITPQCRSNMDDGQIEFTVSDDQCPNRNYIHSIISSPDTVFDLGNGYSGLRPNIPENTYTINVYLVDPNNTDVSVGISKDTTFVLPRKIQISVVGDGETTCALNPDLRLIANPTNSDGTSGGYSYSWKVNGTELSTYQHFDLTSDYTSPTVTVTDGSSCSSTYTPTVNLIENFGEISVTSIDITPACGGDNGTVQVNVTSECGDLDDYISYSLRDVGGSGENNYVGYFSNLAAGTYSITLFEATLTGFQFDTTITVPEQTTCDITATGTPSLTILDYSYEDYENSGNFGEFYYRLEIPSVDGTPESIEVQYGLVGSDSPSSVYYNPSTGAGSIKIPITAKGDWEVKMRARCCGGSFPGNIPGDWFLIDTIHHYPNFAISTEGYCYRIPPAQSENGSVSMTFNPPHNVSSNTSEMRVRIFPVDNSSDIKYDGSGTSGAIELADLSEGDYKVYVYINDGTDENTFNAYLDTTFTIGNRFKIAIQNDSSSICATDSVLYRAIVTGGTEPYDFEWVAYETTFGQFDDSIWVNFDIASSDDPGVTVTDADGCFSTTEIHVNLLPAYTQETEVAIQNMFGDNTYTYYRSRYIIASQLPFTLQDFTFDGSETSASHEFNFQTANGCDSIVHIDFTQKPGIALPSSGNLDTTITTSVDVYDDGGLSSAAALHADRTLTLHAPEGSTLELQLTGTTFNFGEGEALYVYDYNGVNDNMLLFEYRQGMNPPNTDFTSNSRSLTFRYVTGNSCEKGFLMTVNTKDVSNECLPVYNVQYSKKVSDQSTQSTAVDATWEHNGDVIGYATRQLTLKWNDATSSMDTIENPGWNIVTDAIFQFSHYGIYNGINYLDSNYTYACEIRAICSEGDTSEAVSFSYQLIEEYRIPSSGGDTVVLDSNMTTIYVYDGGGLDNDYSDNADGYLVITAADGKTLRIIGGTYELENNTDYIYITDDPTDWADEYRQHTITATGEDGEFESLTSLSRSFKIRLTSDYSVTGTGCVIEIEQIDMPCLPVYNYSVENNGSSYTFQNILPYGGVAGYGGTNDIIYARYFDLNDTTQYEDQPLSIGSDNWTVNVTESGYIGLVHYCSSNIASDCLGKIKVTACTPPEVTTPFSTDMNKATISWVDNGATAHIISYREAGQNMFTDTVVYGNEATIPNLRPQTTYEFSMASICSEGDTGFFSDIYTATTLCGLRPGLAEDELYIEPECLDFSSVEAGDGIYNMPECWNRIECIVEGRTYPYIAKYTEGNDFYALDFAAESSYDQYAVLPQVDTLFGSMDKWALQFTVNYRDFNGGSCNAGSCRHLIIGVMTDPSDASTFTPVDSVETFSYIDDAQYIVPLRDYHGTGLYPAFKYWANGGLMHDLLVSDVIMIPDLHIEEPTNLRVTEHPSQSGKALVTWDCEDIDESFPDDGFEDFLVSITSSDGMGDMSDITYDKNFTFSVNPGVSYTIRVSHQKPSARFRTTLTQTGLETITYIAPTADNQTIDTTADLSVTDYISNTMPFKYGENSSSIILFQDIETTSIDGIAFRTAPNCYVDGFQKVNIYLKDVDLSSISVIDNGGSYMIGDVTPYTFTDSEIWHSSNLKPRGEGWMTFTFDSTYTHNPDKNLLIGVATEAGDYTDGYEGLARFYLETHAPNPDATEGRALLIQGYTYLNNIPQNFSENPIYTRPQMLFISNKNCTNDTLTIDTNLCENATIEWRGESISFSDEDIEIHKVAIDSTYNYGWDYTYAYVFNDKVEGVGTGGCDSIYQLRITKRYNEDNNYALENDGFPHVVNCGPYTWQNGVTYDYSMGTYVIQVPGQCDSYGSHGPRVYDTVPGVTAYGCDSIYGLNLTVEPWYTVVFDTTGVDAGTGMTPVNICEGEDYDLPQCTMTMAYKHFVAWEIDGEWYDEGDAYESDWIEGDTLYVRPVFECDVEEIATDYEDLCPVGGEYEWRGKTITMDYAVQHGRIDSIAGVYYIYVYDSVAGAVAGVCDSIYTLRLNMENRLILDEAVINQCEAQGWTWNSTYGDMNHYDSDMGWRWVDDDDDGHKEFDMSTAAIYIDSNANNECGRLSLLSLEIEDDGEDHDIDTVIFIKYKIEYGDGIDTLHSMTMYVCDDNEYFVPECPDTVTREGYDFVYWSDWPECGWEVEPGSSQYAGSGTIYLYGMWESNCEDKEAADTTVMCPNDTLSWHGFTLRGPELQIGEWDSVMTKYGVIPGECDSIYHMHVTVLSRPTLILTEQEEPLCAGMSTAWINVAVNEGNTPFQYALGDSNYTAAFDTTEHKFENLAAGTHTVWVKDACGVTDNVEVTITQPTEIMITNMQAYDSTACYGSSHSVNLAVDGGTSPYTYLWNSDINHMESYLEINTNVAGTHNDTILVTDANGCTATASYTTKVYDSLSVSVSGNDTTYCYGATATPLVVTVEGGVTDSGYTYQWYNYGTAIDGATGSSFTVPTTSGVQYDNITVMVDNICGAKTVAAPSITVLDSLRMDYDLNMRNVCFGGSTGQIEVYVQGGGAFTGQWYMNGTAVTDNNPGDADNKYTPRTDTAGTFSYSLKLTSNAGCGSDSAEVAIVTVYEPFAVTAHGRDTSYCPYAQADTLSISITGNNEEGNTVISWQAIRDTDTTNVNNNSPVNTTYVPETSTAGTTLYRAIVQDGCGTDTVNVATITVIDNTVTLIAPTADASQEVCLGSDITPIPIEYENGDTISVDGLPNGLTLTHHHDGKDTIMGTINADYSGAYTVTISNSCGGSHMFSFILTVKDTVKLTAPVTNQTQEICLGTAITEIPIEYSNGTLSISPDLPEGLTITTHGTGHDTIKGTPTAPLSATDYMVTVHGDCGNKAFTFSLTVQEAINLATQFDTTYCFGAQAAPITLSPNGGNGEYTYLWVVANHDDMMPSDTLSVTSNSYTPTTDSAADYYYRVTITSGACRSERDVARIYVMEPVVMQSTADSLAICLGTEGNMYDLTDLTSGGNDYEYTYKWFKNGVEIDGETSGIYTPVGSAAGTFTYRAIAIDDMGCMSDTATIGVLTVHSPMAVTADNHDTAYCYGVPADTLRLNVSGGSGNYNYRWFVHDYYETVLGTTAKYKPSTDEAGTTLYDVEVTDNECGYDTTITVANITVYGNFTPVEHGIVSDYVCVNSEVTPLTVELNGGSGDFTYQWYVDVINGVGDTISIDTLAGATQNTYQPIADSVFTRDEFHYYHVIVTDRVCPADEWDVYWYGMSVVDSIRIRPSVFQGTEDSTICYGNSIGIIVNLDSIGGSYGKEYYWYIDGEADTYNTNTEPTTPTYSADNPDNPIPGGTYDLSVRVRDNIGCGSDSAHVVTITVHDQFEVNAEEQSNIYCLNSDVDTLTLEGQIIGSGDYEYQWYAVTGETVEVIDTLAGATNNWYVPATNLAGEVEYRVKVTDLNCGSDTIVSLGYITVMDSIRILSSVDSLYACLGAEAGTFGVEYEGVGEMDYDWYLNGTEVYRDMVNEFMPSSDSAGVFDYYLVLRSNYGCASDSVLAGVLTVYSPMAVTVDNQDTDYCYGGQADTLRVNVNGGSGRFAYQWMQNGDIADMGRDFVPSTTEVGTTNYSVRVYDSLCGSDTTVMVAAITVHNGAIVSIDDTTALTACYGAVNWNRSLTVIDTTTDTTLTLTYQWYRNDVAIDAATESTYTITSPLNTTGTLIYTVAVSDNYGCTDTTLHALRLTAYPDVSWSRPSDLDQQQHVCINGTANELSVIPSGGNGNYSIAWCDNINYSTLSTDSLYTPPIDSIGTTIINFSLRSVGIDYCAGSFGAAYYINVHDVSTGIDTVTACDSYTWIDTVTYTETPADAMPTFVLQNQYGCDSTVTLNLTINYSNRDTVTQTSCDIYIWMMTGQSYTTSGYYFDTVQNMAGCDSIVMLNLTVNPSTASNDTVTACDSYAWNNSNYSTSGTYTSNLINAAGCDSTATLYLTVNYSNSATDTVTTCDSVTWIDGNTYSARVVAESPTYTYSNGNAAGCDSVVTLHLVLADSYTARFLVELADTSFYTDSIDECVLNPALVIPENEYEYDMHEFIGWYNQATGDTVQPGDTVLMTESLTFNTVWRTLCSNVDTVSYATICDGDTITWRGYTVTSAQAEYADTVAGVVDVLCDSVYHLLLTVNYPTTSDTTMLACDSVWWNGMFFTETPDTTQSFFMAGGNQYGCDSTAYLNLTVNYSIHDYVVETACDSYVFDNVTYTESTDLPSIGAISDNGCPFITHISLTVNHSYHGEDSATACDLFVWNDMQLTEGGDHDYVGYTSDGCDSVVTLHLTMHYTSYGMDSQTACDSLVWIDGNTYFSDFPGEMAEITYLFPAASMYGCDSVAVLDLTMEDHIYVQFLSDFGDGWMDEVAACVLKPLLVPECEYVNEGFVFDGWSNQMDTLKVLPGDTIYLENSVSYYATWVPLCEDVIVFTDTAMCEGSSFVWRGHDYSDELFSGDYEDVAYGVIENYCDSVFYLRLTVFPVSRNEFFDSVAGEYYWHDSVYTTSGVYELLTGYNRYGCDSTEVLHLTIYLGIDGKEGELQVKVYPNPTSGLVTVDAIDVSRISVMDMVGRTVATFDNTNRIDISDLPAGIYTLYVQTSEGETTRRVMKR